MWDGNHEVNSVSRPSWVLAQEKEYIIITETFDKAFSRLKQPAEPCVEVLMSPVDTTAHRGQESKTGRRE